jgi:hypothetical protein
MKSAELSMDDGMQKEQAGTFRRGVPNSAQHASPLFLRHSFFYIYRANGANRNRIVDIAINTTITFQIA